MKREFVKDFIDLEEHIFCGNLSYVQKQLAFVEDNLMRKGNKEVVFDWHSDYDYQCVRAHFYRPETDDEMDKRKKRLVKKMAKLEEEKQARLDLYEELKKEFEK